MWLPLPFVGNFSLRKRVTAMFPTARWFAVVGIILAFLSWLSLIGGLVVLFAMDDGDAKAQWFRAAIAGTCVLFALKWFWFRKVRIVRIGEGSLEVRFASRGYAEEFCRINDFHCRERPINRRPAHPW
jgi:hypothetical protein